MNQMEISMRWIHVTLYLNLQETLKIHPNLKSQSFYPRFNRLIRPRLIPINDERQHNQLYQKIYLNVSLPNLH
jgi:hypothetical protein